MIQGRADLEGFWSLSPTTTLRKLVHELSPEGLFFSTVEKF
jgi:hypothetical protein